MALWRHDPEKRQKEPAGKRDQGTPKGPRKADAGPKGEALSKLPPRSPAKTPALVGHLMEKTMTTSTDDILKRMESAKKTFKETLMYYGKIDEASAEIVMRYYLDKKLAKIDIGIGRVNVKNGALLDKTIIDNVVASLA